MRREILAPLQAVADRWSSWYLDLGVRHFCVGHDVGILYDCWGRAGPGDAQRHGGVRPVRGGGRSPYGRGAAAHRATSEAIRC